jgi:hypothetical protein
MEDEMTDQPIETLVSEMKAAAEKRPAEWLAHIFTTYHRSGIDRVSFECGIVATLETFKENPANVLTLLVEIERRGVEINNLDALCSELQHEVSSPTTPRSLAMTADLKAARKDAQELIEDYGGHIGAVVSTLITALDQAAEALKPIAAKLVDIGQDEADDDRFSNARSPYNQAVSVKVGDVRRAATVYATLKPVDTKEGEGATPSHLSRLANAPHVEPDHDWDGDEGREGRRDLTEDEG